MLLTVQSAADVSAVLFFSAPLSFDSHALSGFANQSLSRRQMLWPPKTQLRALMYAANDIIMIVGLRLSVLSYSPVFAITHM